MYPQNVAIGMGEDWPECPSFQPRSGVLVALATKIGQAVDPLRSSRTSEFICLHSSFFVEKIRVKQKGRRMLHWRRIRAI